MEIRIGIQHSPRELVIESDENAEAVLERLNAAADFLEAEIAAAE